MKKTSPTKKAVKKVDEYTGPKFIAIRCAIHDTPVSISTSYTGEAPGIERFMEVRCNKCHNELETLEQYKRSVQKMLMTTTDEKDEPEEQDDL